MTENDVKQLLMDMMRNKGTMLKSLFDDMEGLEKIIVGTTKVIDSLDNPSEANVRKQLKNNMVAVMKMSESLKRVLLMSVILTSSDDFTTMVAKVGGKMGWGQEFLQEMFRQKMEGK